MKEIFKTLLALILTALTPDGGQIPPELQTEVDALSAAIDAIPEGGGEPIPEDKAKEGEILDKITNLAGMIKNSAVQAPIMNKVTEAKFIAVNTAMKAFNKVQNELGLHVAEPVSCDLNAMITNKGYLKFVPKNANNTTFKKSLQEEFSINQVLRQAGFLTGLKEMSLNGANTIDWIEGTRGTNVAAVVAIGSDVPTKANTTAVATKATDTLAQITTASVQSLRAINGLQSVYQDDIQGDLEDKVALQVAAVLTAAANPINILETCEEPNVQDVIKYAYLQLKPYAKGNRIAIAIPNQKFIGISILKDKIGNPLPPLNIPDLDIVTFIPTVTYTSDMIFGWVEGMSVRFYNDGLQVGSDELNGNGVSGDNFKKNQISLKAQYLNEGLLIRGTDVVTTVVDSIQGCINELTAGA